MFDQVNVSASDHEMRDAERASGTLERAYSHNLSEMLSRWDTQLSVRLTARTKSAIQIKTRSEEIKTAA